MYDCIIVLGGGINNDGIPNSFVIDRLNESLKYKTKYYLLTSRGTTHKAPPVDENNFPYDECMCNAKYLLSKGINSSKILLENWSLDTIGNSYGSLVFHILPNNFKNILVITSNFHMARSKNIFTKVFSLVINNFNLEFLEIKSNIENIDLRIEKEKHGLEKWISISNDMKTLSDLHHFLFLEHNAYCIKKNEWKEWNNNYLCTY